MFTMHKAQTYYSHVKLKTSFILPEGLKAASDLAGISAFGYICIDYSFILTSLYIHLTSNIHTLSKHYYRQYRNEREKLVVCLGFFLVCFKFPTISDIWSLSKIQMQHTRYRCSANDKASPELEEVSEACLSTFIPYSL